MAMAGGRNKVQELKATPEPPSPEKQFNDALTLYCIFRGLREKIEAVIKEIEKAAPSERGAKSEELNVIMHEAIIRLRDNPDVPYRNSAPGESSLYSVDRYLSEHDRYDSNRDHSRPDPNLKINPGRFLDTIKYGESYAINVAQQTIKNDKENKIQLNSTIRGDFKSSPYNFLDTPEINKGQGTERNLLVSYLDKEILPARPQIEAKHNALSEATIRSSYSGGKKVLDRARTMASEKKAASRSPTQTSPKSPTQDERTHIIKDPRPPMPRAPHQSLSPLRNAGASIMASQSSPKPQGPKR